MGAPGHHGIKAGPHGSGRKLQGRRGEEKLLQWTGCCCRRSVSSKGYFRNLERTQALQGCLAFASLWFFGSPWLSCTMVIRWKAGFLVRAGGPAWSPPGPVLLFPPSISSADPEAVDGHAAPRSCRRLLILLCFLTLVQHLLSLHCLSSYSSDLFPEVSFMWQQWPVFLRSIPFPCKVCCEKGQGV